MATPQMFFITGPLRTGSSLMSRCIDDHPDAICLCESEINRALFRDYFVQLHLRRMQQHGLVAKDVIGLLDRRKQDEIASLLNWYRDSQSIFKRLYEKPDIVAYGDKSPDFFRCPDIVQQFSREFPLIYTVRDPRAIFYSIRSQDGPTSSEKIERWSNLAQNFVQWESYLDQKNILCVRYEDLLTSPENTMATVYRHIGLPESSRFLQPFERKSPRRFLWKTAIDWQSGVSRDFDQERMDRWKSGLSSSELGEVCRDHTVQRFLKRFGYE